MSQPVRNTLATLITVVGVLVLGLVAVALGTTGLDGDGVTVLATTTHTSSPVAAPPVPAPSPAPAPAAKHVRLIVDYGDGVQKHFTAIDHKPDMTAFDALLAAKSHARGFELEHSGKGETALVRRIDDLKNQGLGGDRRNWQFFVNDKYATKGAGATKLQPGDVVRWVYEKYKA